MEGTYILIAELMILLGFLWLPALLLGSAFQLFWFYRSGLLNKARRMSMLTMAATFLTSLLMLVLIFLTEPQIIPSGLAFQELQTTAFWIPVSPLAYVVVGTFCFISILWVSNAVN